MMNTEEAMKNLFEASRKVRASMYSFGEALTIKQAESRRDVEAKRKQLRGKRK